MSIPKSKQNPTLDLKSRCYTCLSSGRNLKPMKTEEKFLLGILCPEMFFHNQRNVQYLYLMCWECKYMIIKIRRFQARVSKAQAQMKLNLQGDKSIVDSISNLKITRGITIDLPPQLPQIILKDQDRPPLIEQPPPLVPIITPLKVDPEIIECEIEEETSCVSNDYDELIPPTKIEQPSSDDSTDTASEFEKYDDSPRIPREKTTKIKTKPVTVIASPQTAAKHAIISPNENNELQKVFIEAPKENLALRGHKEAVKPNLPTVENVSIVANNTGSVPNVIKDKVAPTNSKQEEPNLKTLIIQICPKPSKEPPSRESECEQRVGDEEDEVKCKNLKETELKTYRGKKRSMRGYTGHPYKCERCIQTFRTKKYLDQHNRKHDKMQANITIESRENIVALRKNGYNISQISVETGLSRNTVRLWVKRFEEDSSLKSRERSGRPPLITPTQRRSMVEEYKKNVFIPIRTFAHQFNTSIRTVRRVLNAEGLRGVRQRQPAKKRHKSLPMQGPLCYIYLFMEIDCNKEAITKY